MVSSLQYIIDKDGNKNGVLVPINEWEKIRKDLEEYERLKNKKAFFEGLADAIDEVRLIREGKKKPNSFDDLINEI